MKLCSPLLKGPFRILNRGGLTLGLLVLGIQALLLSCSEPEPEAVRERTLVGFSMDSFVVERWERERDMFISHVQDLGGEVILQVANEDPQSQIRQIQSLISQNVDVLVVVANNSYSLGEVLAQARGNGIPVVAYDRMIEAPGIDLYVSFDNVRVGELMALALTEALGSGELVLIHGAQSDQNSRMVQEGVMNILEPLVREGRFVILEEFWPRNWSNQEAYRFMESVLEYRVPQGIIAANDLLAGGAIRALAQRRLAGQVLVTGQDAELSAVQRIAEGTQLMTVYKPLPLIARVAAEAALALARGETVPAEVLLDALGNPVPFVRLEPVAVNREGLRETVIAEGFHRHEDVYRNIPLEQRPAAGP